ncbi:MAG: tetratricopeptide repeat protein [Deltaproteobacteria bacterium]|nr:tetratricopeptide repeat protein [Deltaproteobacteria bacterium]
MSSSMHRLGHIVFVCVLVAGINASATDLLMSENSDVTDGNKLLTEGKPAEALTSYDEAARALPGRHGVHLNRGLALSRMGEEQIDQAMQAFQLASDGGGPDDVRARASANLGNAFFKKEDYAKAIELYKKSLMLSPGNKDIAWNLELAKQKKKQKEEQEKKDQQDQDKQDQDKQDQDQQDQDQQNQDQKDQQDQQKKDEQKKDEQKKDEQKKQQPEQEQKKEEQQPPPQPKTKQEIEQVLDSLENQQENLQKEMARKKGAMVPAGRFKDW